MHYDTRWDPRYTVSIIHSFNVAFFYSGIISLIFKIAAIVHIYVYTHPSCEDGSVKTSRISALFGVLFITLVRCILRLDTIAVCEKLTEKAAHRYVGVDLKSIVKRTSETLSILLAAVSVALYAIYGGKENFEESACNLLAQAYIDILAKAFAICTLPGIVFHLCYLHMIVGGNLSFVTAIEQQRMEIVRSALRAEPGVNANNSGDGAPIDGADGGNVPDIPGLSVAAQNKLPRILWGVDENEEIATEIENQVQVGEGNQHFNTDIKTWRDLDERGDNKCLICFCDYEDEERIKVLPCGHAFHESCIKEWFANNKCCVIRCNYDLETGQQLLPTTTIPSTSAASVLPPTSNNHHATFPLSPQPPARPPGSSLSPLQRPPPPPLPLSQDMHHREVASVSALESHAMLIPAISSSSSSASSGLDSIYLDNESSLSGRGEFRNPHVENHSAAINMQATSENSLVNSDANASRVIDSDSSPHALSRQLNFYAIAQGGQQDEEEARYNRSSKTSSLGNSSGKSNDNENNHLSFEDEGRATSGAAMLFINQNSYSSRASRNNSVSKNLVDGVSHEDLEISSGQDEQQQQQQQHYIELPLPSPVESKELNSLLKQPKQQESVNEVNRSNQVTFSNNNNNINNNTASPPRRGREPVTLGGDAAFVNAASPPSFLSKNLRPTSPNISKLKVSKEGQTKDVKK